MPETASHGRQMQLIWLLMRNHVLLLFCVDMLQIGWRQGVLLQICTDRCIKLYDICAPVSDNVYKCITTVHDMLFALAPGSFHV